MKKYAHINTGRPVRLESLIVSTDLRRSDIIQILNANGEFVTKGNWFQDNILAWGDFWGTATKAGTGNTVSFKLLGETRHE